MKILILGQGGREHALVKAFRKSSLNPEIHIVPGNDGMKNEALCFTGTSAQDKDSIGKLCQIHKYDFVFIGPEEPLVQGVSNYLRSQGVPVIGPSQYWAQLEGSKVFAKEFMIKEGIPTAKHQIVSSVDDVRKYVSEFTAPFVLKADGLAGGKGVFICDSLEELIGAATDLFEKNKLGAAGHKALLEQFTPGWELSYLFFTNGVDYVPLPIAQDHKRLYDHQKGPNTGGMGTWASMTISSALEQKIKNDVVLPTLKGLQTHNSQYWGVVFVGIMVNNDSPSVLEYNVRLGDPETQSLLPLIENDFAQFCKNLSQGSLTPLEFNNQFCTCVVLTSPGYPDKPESGLPILGLDQIETKDSQYIIYSGVARNKESKLVTSGGRVLGCVGIGDSRSIAKEKAYSMAQKISWPGIHYRKDIGSA